ncbi:MAG: hypothetical protein CMD92_06830 [Gammaproteobacteria bacterium]|nr:hypothetical protein [Gammaproteobacteria bacterium]
MTLPAVGTGLGCDCSYPSVPVWKWQDGSVLDVRRAINASQVSEEFVSTLHSTESTHTSGNVPNRPMWVPVLTNQVDYADAPNVIARLPCNSLSRGEDSVLFRTFFFTLTGLPLLGPGVFVETGAHDGVIDSTTLFFEKCLGWMGVLIEPHPVVFPKLLAAPREHAIKRQAAVCKKNGTVFIDAWPATPASTHDRPVGQSLEVPCAPLWQLLNRVPAVRYIGRVDLLSLDVEGAEPVAVDTLGDKISYGVVMAEVTAGERRIHTMETMMERGFLYVGQISARPSPANYVISDVWYNRSHFARYWPRSRVMFV